ncbi:Ribose ABC transporter, periplasmic ribose-binding protein RbsB (TC 3.A.1.2.1) [hydrothermal vent metagenome]|uniref:Ribose ABC transporter, periplasmic ribose-binding protein RbsB (TC 3.A.1.2.1) n=1 Tax=hydrothermal vent metagenome TaxID=652676 RepID=A0A3B1CG51_9ZZZZ
MKIKFGVLILATFGLSLVLFSCGQKKETVKYTIGFSQCNSAEPWREAMNKEILNEAAKFPELKIMISDAQQDNSKQVADVENFIVQEVDLLIISPNEAQPLTNIVEKAFDKGIPVIVLDRKVLTEKYTVFIGADNVKIGKAAGEYSAKLLKGKGNVVEIWGLKGSTPAIERHEGFMQGIADHPGIKIIYEQDGAWLRRKGREIMENALQRFDKIDLVYGHNDPMAIGAYLAAKNANRINNTFFIGIDGLPGAEGGAQAVLNGELNATFLYPTGGKKAVQVALDILKGKKVSKTITLGTVTIDKSNAEEYN